VGRLGTVEEFGAAAAFLCSQQAAYITGTTLLVDGGMTAGYLQRERSGVTDTGGWASARS
jgi:NAD(P)-dependent dehydrogenase (short-subunit alcohol dehydrogenase family)